MGGEEVCSAMICSRIRKLVSIWDISILFLKGKIMAEASPKTPKKSAPKAVKPDAADAKTETKKVTAKTAPKKTAPSSSSKPLAPPVAAKKSAPKAAAPAAKAAAPSKAAVKKTPAKAGSISDEQRYRMIAEAAYYRAESCQFKSDPLRDWIEAERDIAILLKENV